MDNALIIIPARMKAERLPGKPLADIGGIPMIVRCYNLATKAVTTKAGADVFVATDDELIKKAVEDAGGKAVMTSQSHQSGTDRVCEAADIIDPHNKYEIIVNVQGDQPFLDPTQVSAAIAPLSNPLFEIGTAMIPAKEDEKNLPSVVKPVVTRMNGEGVGEAIYFSRSLVPYGDGEVFCHLGIYSYRRAALRKFVGLPPSPLEKREKLEQLRALENNMRIGIKLTTGDSLSVDTPEDLEKVRRMV
jgi:3-deoxy-manno-octulosonate cytidylyltransferase (CMP-KDO synthetase)